MLKQQEQAVIVISARSGSISDSGLANKSSAEFLVNAGQHVLLPGIVGDCCRWFQLSQIAKNVTTLLTACEVLHGNAAVAQQRQSWCLVWKLSVWVLCGCVSGAWAAPCSGQVVLARGWRAVCAALVYCMRAAISSPVTLSVFLREIKAALISENPQLRSSTALVSVLQ